MWRFIFPGICATAFEFLTAQVMLKLFGEVWWNYEHLPFNYKGILCLESTLGWGVLALLIFGIFNSLVEGVVFMMEPGMAMVVGSVLVIAYIVDFSVNFAKNISAKNNFSLMQVVRRIKKR